MNFGRVDRSVQTVHLRVFDVPVDAQRAAAELLVEAARSGEPIALSGGDSPGPAYEQAAKLEPDWSRARLWWGDERCVPPDDDRSNYLLVKRTLLDRIGRQPSEVQRIHGELGGEAAAAEYDRLLAGVRLGLALQGIGPDGHTASLFPNSPALGERERRAVAVPHDDVERVTMTLPVLSGAQQVVFLVLGEQKADAVERAFAGPPDPATPASLLRSESGETIVLLDRAAAVKLDNVG
ncbi:MAG: 6-phosphogluconolactonase [Actinobacteria bacterium]|nr:MAG: 6-phosphogluconolactonase [Actinomycetota bacterium]